MTTTRAMKVTTPSDREILVTREFDAPRQLVFEAMTKPDLVKRWLYGPDEWRLAVCEIDLRVGGTLRYVWRKTKGVEMGLSGVYREITPPERIVHTELFDQDWTGGETLVTTVLTESGGKTMMSLTVLYSSQEARDAALKTPMEEGMGQGYDRLADLLASRKDG